MMQLILNELSWSTPAESRYAAREWMKALQETAAKAIEHGLDSVILVCTNFLSIELASGYFLNHWLTDPEVELELRQVLQGWITWGPFLDDFYEAECSGRVEVSYKGQVGIGLGVAVARDHALLSNCIDPWRHDPLPVDVRDATQSTTSQGHVCNLHCADVVSRRMPWIAARCCVKPRYENPGHHDPASGVFRGGRGMTMVLPDDAEEVYRKAIPADAENKNTTWWGQNANGFLYRYAASWQGCGRLAHWNGTTDPSSERVIEDHEIPTTIRRAFPRRKR